MKKQIRQLFYLIPAGLCFVAWMITSMDVTFKCGIVLMLYGIYDLVEEVKEKQR